MSFDDQILIIDSGLAIKENREDAIYMCFAVAGRLNMQNDAFADVYQRDLMEQKLHSAVDILCFLATPDKQQTQREAMQRARLSYHTIASNALLQIEFAIRVAAADAAGALASPAASRNLRLWEFLNRNRDTPMEIA